MNEAGQRQESRTINKNKQNTKFRQRVSRTDAAENMENNRRDKRKQGHQAPEKNPGRSDLSFLKTYQTTKHKIISFLFLV